MAGFDGFGEHFIVLFDFVLARLEGFWVWGARRERVVLLNNDGGGVGGYGKGSG